MEKIKQNRCAGFVIVGIVYVIAAIVGIALYKALNYDWWLNLLIADIVATAVTFAFSVIFGNASVYDPYWSVQPVVILWAFCSNLHLPKLLMLIAVSFWGVRLTANWAYTFHGLMHQDWRYTMLRETTKKFYPVINFIGIHMVPTLIVYGCTVPAVYVMLHDAQANAGSILFFLLSVGAATMQGIADIQMHRHRRSKNGGFIRTGLWKYSRHPNYLGEILMWWGIALSAVSVFPEMWYLCAGAVANTILFFAVSIPMADKRQSRKADFSDYKKQTRMLLPIKK
ncbi:MAG: DUF1295 domain-containing protein [Christensenellaceae bacterium]|nr:DUF1295 domain-containing protein [Christensenellaceae bacterium]